MSECLYDQEQDVNEKCLWGVAEDADGKPFGATIHIGPITQESCDQGIECVCRNCGAVVDVFKR